MYLCCKLLFNVEQTSTLYMCVSVVTSCPVCPRQYVSSLCCECSTSATTSYQSFLLPYTDLHISGNWYVQLAPLCQLSRAPHHPVLISSHRADFLFQLYVLVPAQNNDNQGWGEPQFTEYISVLMITIIRKQFF